MGYDHVQSFDKMVWLYGMKGVFRWASKYSLKQRLQVGVETTDGDPQRRSSFHGD